MTKEEAESLSLVLLRVVGTLDQTASFVRDKDESASWDRYRKAVGRAMGVVALDLAEPLWERFPELRPEQLGGAYKVHKSIYEPLFYDPDSGA